MEKIIYSEMVRPISLQEFTPIAIFIVLIVPIGAIGIAHILGVSSLSTAIILSPISIISCFLIWKDKKIQKKLILRESDIAIVCGIHTISFRKHEVIILLRKSARIGSPSARSMIEVTPIDGSTPVPLDPRLTGSAEAFIRTAKGAGWMVQE